MEKFKGFFIRRQIRICQKSAYTKNIAKGTTDPRVEFVSQDHSSQFTNIEHITILESRLSINFKILIKTSNISIWTKSRPNLASEY